MNQNYSDMLKRHMPTQMLVEEMKERNYFFRKVRKSQDWFGGRYEIPFEGGEASSIKLGSMHDASDIAQTQAILGYEDSYKEIWGAIAFYEKDLDLNQDQKSSFLKLLPDKLDQFLRKMEREFSHQILVGAKVDTLTVNGTAGGVAEVSFPERFVIGQKYQIRNSDPVAADVYVIAIDISGKSVTLSATRGGAALNIAAYTVAKASALYIDGSVNVATGALQNTFNSLRDSLLSAANGGSASIHNKTKASYPFLQAINIDGSGFTAANLLESIFSSMMEVARIGKGNPTEIIMSFGNYSACVKDLELNRQYAKGDVAAGFGFRTINLSGTEGSYSFTAVREMEDDIIYLLDWNAIKLAGSHFFDMKRHGSNNDVLFPVRSTAGFTYIADIRLYGNLIVQNPSYCGIIHSISF